MTRMLLIDSSGWLEFFMADAIVYAIALVHNAKLVTSDADLASLPGITYLKKG